jgi:hypothetical protein
MALALRPVHSISFFLSFFLQSCTGGHNVQSRKQVTTMCRSTQACICHVSILGIMLLHPPHSQECVSMSPKASPRRAQSPIPYARSQAHNLLELHKAPQTCLLSMSPHCLSALSMT